ncbi:hypothetical protein B484DRAFT_390023 [Ochromonadaceae sp. CCMP2298]|nr:hypothetical protein B484DRAFT_390023 [Ochromonadaceae sp. CCMP2298]
MKAALLLLAWCWNPLVYADRRGGGTGGGGPSGLKGFLGSWGEDRGRDRGDRSDRRFPRERDGDWDRDRDSFVRDRRDGDWRDGDRGRDSRDSRDSRDRSVDRDRDRGRSVGGATWNDLALVVTGKLLSYAAFALAFRLISRSLASSWTKAVSDISTTKSPLSPNITQYLAPNCTLNSYEEEILSSVTLPVGDSFADVGGLFSVKQQPATATLTLAIPSLALALL